MLPLNSVSEKNNKLMLRRDSELSTDRTDSVCASIDNNIDTPCRLSAAPHLTRKVRSLRTQPILRPVSSRRVRTEQEGDLNVNFSTLTIREFAITVGDNPAGNHGTPLTMEWKHESEVTLSIDDYEDNRPDRRTGREMIIPSSVRQEMLRSAGFARKELIALTKPVNITRSQRKQTIALMSLSPLQELSESVGRKAWNALTRGQRKKAERKLLESWTNLDEESSEFSEDRQESSSSLQSTGVETSAITAS